MSGSSPVVRETRDVRRRSLATAALAISLLVAGCGGDDDESTATTSTTTSTTAPTTTDSAPPSTTTTTTPVDCGPPAQVPAPGATDVSRKQVDADGDGEGDDAYAYLDGGVPTVAVRLAGGTTAVVPTGEPAGTLLGVLGGHDLGGGGDTVFVQVGSGASVEVIGLFELDGCTLTRVTLAGGEPAAFAVGGTVTHADGLRCVRGDDGPGLEVLTATSVDGQTFSTDDRAYRLVGTELVQVGSTTGTLTSPGDADAIERHYRLDCPFAS